MTTPNRTSRRALLGAMASLPALAFAAPAIAQALPQGGDSELLATFDAYCRAWAAFNDSPVDGPDQDALEAEYRRLFAAMDNAPIPTTLRGAAARLRFAMEGMSTAARMERACLCFSPAERAAHFRAVWNTMDTDEVHLAAAIIAIEAIDAA